jgi:hypothetical protein
MANGLSQLIACANLEGSLAEQNSLHAWANLNWFAGCGDWLFSCHVCLLSWRNGAVRL